MDAGTIIRGTLTTSDRDTAMKLDTQRRELYEQEPATGKPLVQLVMRGSSKPTKTAKHEWYMQRYNPLVGTITDVYTDAGLASAYSSGGVSGSRLYLKMAENDAKQLVSNMLVKIISSDATTNQYKGDVNAIVLDVVLRGASSFAAIQLLEADDNGASASAILDDTTLTWRPAGDSHAELSGWPEEVYEEPTSMLNYCPIFMESLSMSYTEMVEESAEVLSTKAYARKIKQSRGRFDKKLEGAYMFSGPAAVSVGRNGKRSWVMRGLVPAITTYAPNNVFDYATDSDFSGKNWLAGGWDFFKKISRYVTPYRTETPVLVCGDLVKEAIIDLVTDMTNINIGPTYVGSYGIEVTKLTLPLGEIEIAVSTRLSTDSALRQYSLLVEPSHIHHVPLVGMDVQFVSAKKRVDMMENGFDFVTGFQEGWYGQLGMEYNNLDSMAVIKNIGLTNVG